MKNLFSINKNVADSAVLFDENEYLRKQVGDETRDLIVHALDVLKKEPEAAPPTPRQLKLKKRSRTLWGIGLISLAAAVVLFFLSDKSESFVPIAVQLALLVVSVVTTLWARITDANLASTRRPAKADYTEATDRLHAASEAAARELEVPRDAVPLEILPFSYRIEGGVPVAVGKKNHFDNISTSAWVADGVLCLATAMELYCVPLSDIRGTRQIDEEFEVDFWLKSEPPTSEAYAAYNIRKAGYFAKKCRTFYAIEIGENYELLIPCYDLPTFEKLTGKQ